MRDPRRRRSAALVAVLATALLLAQLPGTAVAKAPPDLGRFLQALGHVESGGRYDARNALTGAYGKYQILPSSWRAWALRYLGSSYARPTPQNQEIVAAHKVTALFEWLGGWRYVAHWWLTGSSSKDVAAWSPFARRYVSRVLALFALGLQRFVDDAAAKVAYSGAWRTAGFHAYAGGRAHYSTASGASVRFTFVGRSVTWVGPVGPTRGRAAVFVDGRFARIVNLRRGGFLAGVALFTRSWSTTGAHAITIRVVGSGRPVAIEGFRVGA